MSNEIQSTSIVMLCVLFKNKITGIHEHVQFTSIHCLLAELIPRINIIERKKDVTRY